MKKSLCTSALKTRRTRISQSLSYPTCKTVGLHSGLQGVSLLSLLPSLYCLIQEEECGLKALQLGYARLYWRKRGFPFPVRVQIVVADMKRRGKQLPLNLAKIIKKKRPGGWGGGQWAQNHESPHSLPINNHIVKRRTWLHECGSHTKELNEQASLEYSAIRKATF